MNNLTLTQIIEGLKTKKFSSKELVSFYIKQISEKDDINAYLEVFEDALKEAERADNLRDEKSDNFLGVPVAIKDNILIKGKNVSAASKMLEGYKAVYNATVIEKLKQKGAIFLGRTNMDEFAMGSSTENSAYKITKNPHDKTRVPGGSSGGSAAAVAADLAPVAIGTDTGGSIRQPASFCGVVGYKPTYGRVSRYGVIAMGSSLDQVGPIAKNVEDAEILFNAIEGVDKKDNTTIQKRLDINLKDKYTIGYPKEFVDKYLSEDVKDLFYKSLSSLEKNGHKVVSVSLDNVDKSLLAYYIIMSAEVSTNLARYDGMRFAKREQGRSYEEIMENTRAKFGLEAKRRILLGTFVLSAGYYDAYYRKAVKLRNYVKSIFDKVFESVDFVATPTSPTPAFKIGEKETPTQMYVADVFTVPVNIAYLPAISIPMRTNDLPVGIQFIGKYNHDEQVFDIGKKFEKCNN